MRPHLVLAVLGTLSMPLSATTSARAWLFVEHTEIGRSALAPRSDVPEPLSRDRVQALQLGWNAVREGGNTGNADLCGLVGVADSVIEAPPSAGESSSFSHCVDLPMLAAIAGDHSCDEEDLAATVRSSWLHDLIAAFASNYQSIRKTGMTSDRRESLWHEGHLEAQKIDAEYLSRAQQNGSHFVLPRTAPYGRAELVSAYVQRVSQLGAPTNAVGLYVAYHARALAVASAAHCKEGKCESPQAARGALLLEAVALHFLQDAFSSGHVVGGPNDAARATRMGTHDYYCAHGLSTETWDRSTAYAAFGDAHFQYADRLQASWAVRRSLAQLADVLLALKATPPGCNQSTKADVCTGATLPATTQDCSTEMLATLQLLPAPPLEAAQEPSFRNEVGAFIHFSASADTGIGWTSYAAAPSPSAPQAVPTWGLGSGVGLGISLAGVTTASSDATAFFQIGLRADAGQRTQWCFNCSRSQEPLDTRMGTSLRLRLPYWLIPGDFIPLGLAALAGSKGAFNLLVSSAEGGAYGRWQRVHPLGKSMALQIVVGRELEWTIYQHSRIVDGGTNGCKGTLACSSSFTAPVFDFIVNKYFSDLASSRAKLTLAYRVELSDVATAHFAVVSLASESNLYFSGF